MEPHVRVKSLAVIVRPENGAMLVEEGDNRTGGRFARPLGGSIEFGERAVDALGREIVEELGCELSRASFLAVLENHFHQDGVQGHEIIFVFRCDLAEPSLYRRESIPILDVPGLEAIWRHRQARSPRLVPEGLADLLAANGLLPA